LEAAFSWPSPFPNEIVIRINPNSALRASSVVLDGEAYATTVDTTLMLSGIGAALTFLSGIHIACEAGRQTVEHGAAARLLSPFVPLFRELAEMRYLWTTPTHMGNDRLIKILGAEPRTPLSIAVRETLAGMGCLPDAVRHNVATLGGPLATARQSPTTPG
jgi:hypothetical protein